MTLSWRVTTQPKSAVTTKLDAMLVPPARFRHPIDAPDPAAHRHYGRFLKDPTSKVWREQADALAAALYQGDPLMDAWVQKAHTLDADEAERLFERALASEPGTPIEGPDELVALFRQLHTVPLWVDPPTLVLGCRTARRAGPVAGAVLSCFSLMGGYRSSAVAKTLAMTGKLRYGASRRLTDTGKFVIALTEPGALHAPGEGFRAVVRVRQVHARVRYGLSRSSKWQTESWGLPINQADMLGTNLLFSMGYLVGARVFGVSFTPEESESVIHLWRYVGYLIGVDETLLPASEREAGRVMYLVEASQPPPDADSIALAQALHHDPMDRATTEIAKRYARVEMAIRSGVSRMLLGDEVADALELPKTAVRYGLYGVPPVVAAIERLRKVAPFGDEIAYRLGERWIKMAISSRA